MCWQVSIHERISGECLWMSIMGQWGRNECLWMTVFKKKSFWRWRPKRRSSSLSFPDHLSTLCMAREKVYEDLKCEIVCMSRCMIYWHYFLTCGCQNPILKQKKPYTGRKRYSYSTWGCQVRATPLLHLHLFSQPCQCSLFKHFKLQIFCIYMITACIHLFVMVLCHYSNEVINMLFPEANTEQKSCLNQTWGA